MLIVERLAAGWTVPPVAMAIGRLAATIAREVRNPPAGIVTSLEIIRRVGDDRAEREEALEVIGRGLEQIERVVSSTLALHQDHGPRRLLRPTALDDLGFWSRPKPRRGESRRTGRWIFLGAFL